MTMSELKTNPLDRTTAEVSAATVDSEVSAVAIDNDSRAAIIEAAALLAASVTKPNKRTMEKVIVDFKSAVADVEKSYSAVS